MSEFDTGDLDSNPFEDVWPADFGTATPERRQEFTQAFSQLPWHLARIDQRAGGYYESHVFNHSIDVEVKKITPFDANNADETDEISLDLESGNRKWSFSSYGTEANTTATGAVIVQFLETLREDEHAGPKESWMREVLEQVYELSRNNWQSHADAVTSLLSKAPTVYEMQMTHQRYNNGARVTASRAAHGPYKPEPRLFGFHSPRELRNLEIRIGGQIYKYSRELSESLIIISSEQDLARTGLADQMHKRHRDLQHNIGLARDLGMDVVTEGKMRVMDLILKQTLESGPADK